MAPLVALTAASPGPDVLYITSNALSGRWKNGFAAWGGICSGVFIYVLATSAGLAAIFALLPGLYYLIKWIGAGYLAYIGMTMIKSALLKKRAPVFKKNVQPIKPLRLFVKGILVTTLNPKAALFFTAFLPQFTTPSSRPISTQLLVLGLFAMAIAQPIYLLYMASFVKIGTQLQRKKDYAGNSNALRSLNGVCGALYLSFAAGLAFWKRA